MENLSAILTVQETAELLRVGASTVYEYARSGYIPSIKVKGRVLIPRDALLKWIEEKTHLKGKKVGA